jgi:hypothetical protein
MKNSELKLDRLFKAARSAPAPEAEEGMSPHLQARVLAHWRADGSRESGWLSLASVFRRALACATLAMLVCLGWSYMDYSDSTATEFASDQGDDAPVAYDVPAELMP